MVAPTISYNNSTGSATAASGAGPSSALSGTSASYSGSVFTLDGSPDLSGVATDGSHCIWVQTSTGRQMFTISAVDDGADTVTVDDAPAGTASGLTWGLGGKRNSPYDTDDIGQIILNDLKAGWTVDIEETGTDYSGTAQISTNSEGDATDGQITFKSSSATRPLITRTTSASTRVFYIGSIDYITFENLDIYDNRGSGTSVAIYSNHASNPLSLKVKNCRLRSNGGTGYGIQFGRNPASLLIQGCHFDGKGSGSNFDGIKFGGSGSDGGLWSIVIQGNNFEGCDEDVVIYRATGVTFRGNISNDAVGSCLQFGDARGEGWQIYGNTCHNPGEDFVEVGDANNQNGMILRNNIVQDAGRYAVNAQAAHPAIDSDHNIYYNSTSGVAPSNTMEQGANDSTSDPGLTDPASDDFSIDSVGAAKGAGWPATWIGLSGLSGFPDIGAVQREEPTGGGSNSGARNPLVGPIG